jgi:hypothetical protein
VGGQRGEQANEVVGVERVGTDDLSLRRRERVRWVDGRRERRRECTTEKRKRQKMVFVFFVSTHLSISSFPPRRPFK